ncbi:hypothetical protein VTH06DRAFT_6657 [Thermothelomyces fergusii]
MAEALNHPVGRNACLRAHTRAPFSESNSSIPAVSLGLSQPCPELARLLLRRKQQHLEHSPPRKSKQAPSWPAREDPLFPHVKILAQGDGHDASWYVDTMAHLLRHTLPVHWSPVVDLIPSFSSPWLGGHHTGAELGGRASSCSKTHDSTRAHPPFPQGHTVPNTPTLSNRFATLRSSNFSQIICFPLPVARPSMRM